MKLMGLGVDKIQRFPKPMLYNFCLTQPNHNGQEYFDLSIAWSLSFWTQNTTL
jgi:hypothetical protein